MNNVSISIVSISTSFLAVTAGLFAGCSVGIGFTGRGPGIAPQSSEATEMPRFVVASATFRPVEPGSRRVTAAAVSPKSAGAPPEPPWWCFTPSRTVPSGGYAAFHLSLDPEASAARKVVFGIAGNRWWPPPCRDAPSPRAILKFEILLANVV